MKAYSHLMTTSVNALLLTQNCVIHTVLASNPNSSANAIELTDHHENYILNAIVPPNTSLVITLDIASNGLKILNNPGTVTITYT